MPQNGVDALRQTSDGYLWVGTRNGLARFDGVSFTRFDATNTTVFKTGSVYGLAEDREANLWISAVGAGLVRYKNGEFKVYGAAAGLPAKNLFLRTAIGTDGKLWVVTDTGIFYYENDRFISFAFEGGVPATDIHGVLWTKAGELWLGSGEKGAFRYRSDGTLIHRYTVKEGLSANIVWSFYEDAQNSIWIGTGNGLTCFRDGRFNVYSEKDGLTGKVVSVITADRDGNLWVGTNGAGLFRLRGEKFEKFDEDEGGLSNNVVRALAQDSEGDLWIGTRGGLDRLRDTVFAAYTTKEKFPTNATGPILAASDGSFYVAAISGGLSRIDAGGGITNILLNSEYNRVFAMAEDAEGNLWAGRFKGGLSLIGRGGKLAGTFTTGDGLAGDEIFSLYVDHVAGGLWVGTFSGLSFFKDGKFTNYHVQDGLPSDIVTSLLKDRTGTLWIGTTASFTRFVDGKFVAVAENEPGLANANVSDFYEDAEGAIWLLNSKGISRYKDGKFASVTEEQGFINIGANNLLEDEMGTFWMSGIRGIESVSRAALNAVADGRANRIEPRIYTTLDGLRGTEGVVQARPSIVRRVDGKICFSTTKGAACTDPRRIKTNERRPPVFIEKVVADEKILPIENALKLAASSGRVEFHFAALSFSVPERVKFRYRLEGVDPEWLEPQQGQRFATYTNLPPGKYEFKIKAANEDGVWNNAGATLKFTKLPYFYQTWWFYLACAAGLIVVGFLLHRLRLQARLAAQQQQYQAVINERMRLARDLHDTLLRGFTGVTMQLMAASKTYVRSPENAKMRLDRTISLASNTLTEARHAIWDMQPPALEGQPLVEALRTGCKQACPPEVKLEINLNGHPVKLPEKTEVTLLRAAQEAVTNAVRHGQATEIRVQLAFANQQIRLSVQDNGCGFQVPQDFAATVGHWGLLGMKQRVESLGGSFHLTSTIGLGTEVRLETPA